MGSLAVRLPAQRERAGRLHPLSDLCRGLRRSGLLRLDGGLDGEVLRLLTHQDCGAGHRKDNSKDDRRGDPEQALRLGDFGAWSNRALHLRLRSGRQAGAVELRRHFGRLGPLPGFIATARDNGWRVERVPVVGLVRSDRLGRVERRQSGQTFILAVLRSHRRSGPAGPRNGGGLVGHCSSQLGSSRRSHRSAPLRLASPQPGLALAAGSRPAGSSLARRRRPLRRALNGHGCDPGLAWRTGLRRRSRRRSGRRGRRRRAGALDRRECGGGGGGAALGAATGFPATGGVGVGEARGGAGSCGPYLSSISAIAASSAVSSRVMSLSGSGGRKLLSCSTRALRARS